MSETPAPTDLPGVSPAESERMQLALKDIAERSQRLLQDFAERYKADGPQPADPMHLTQTFMDFTAKMMADPNRLVQAQMELWQQYMKLWQATAQRMMGQTVEPVAEPAKGDKRFADPAWKDEVVFDYLKQSYLLTARWLQGTVKEVEGVDAKAALGKKATQERVLSGRDLSSVFGSELDGGENPVASAPTPSSTSTSIGVGCCRDHFRCGTPTSAWARSRTRRSGTRSRWRRTTGSSIDSVLRPGLRNGGGSGRCSSPPRSACCTSYGRSASAARAS